jgi:hypothetical protein
MQSIIPLIESGKTNRKFALSSTTLEDINTATDDHSQDGDDIVEFPEEEIGEGNKETENQDQPKPIKKRRYPVKDTIDVDKCFMDYLQTKTRKSSQNADEQFLLSLLPDMAEIDLR